jgi:hypothetical protein
VLDASKYMRIRDEDDDKHGYDYLMRLQVKSFTTGKITQLNNELSVVKANLDAVIKKSEQEMWKIDLDVFETAYSKFVNKI